MLAADGVDLAPPVQWCDNTCSMTVRMVVIIITTTTPAAWGHEVVEV